METGVNFTNNNNLFYCASTVHSLHCIRKKGKKQDRLCNQVKKNCIGLLVMRLLEFYPLNAPTHLHKCNVLTSLQLSFSHLLWPLWHFQQRLVDSIFKTGLESSQKQVQTLDYIGQWCTAWHTGESALYNRWRRYWQK